MERYFSKISPLYWWEKFVLPILNKADSQCNKNSSYEDISSLDIYYLIKVLLGNWNELRNIDAEACDRFSLKNKELVNKVKEIRNEIAHQCYNPGKDLKYFDNDCLILETFALFLDTNMDECIHELHNAEKEKVLNYISKEVLLPALNSKILDEKTKASVDNTYKRLLQTNRAREIIDFFNSSLEGIRGKEICDKLRECGLKAFEDIKNEINILYFGLK